MKIFSIKYDRLNAEIKKDNTWVQYKENVTSSTTHFYLQFIVNDEKKTKDDLLKSDNFYSEVCILLMQTQIH